MRARMSNKAHLRFADLKASPLGSLMLQLKIRASSLATTLACAAFGADAAGPGTNDLVAAAD
jgi:hypothetical protein